MNQYSNIQIELNNCFNIGEIESEAVYKANLIANTKNCEVQVNNAYNINNGLNAIGNGEYTGNIENKMLDDFRSEAFISLLNKNIGENTLWNKWKLGEDGYPTFE